MAPLVRPHTKSRNGCRTCRTRRVKCDEVGPVCGNCTRRDIECVWKSNSETQHEKRSQSPAQSQSPSLSTSSESLPRNLSASAHSAEHPQLDVMTLELMHHYTGTLCHALFQPQEDPALLHVWKTVVPALAFTDDAKFLLHGLLAVSALHLYHLDPTASRYAYAAAGHHSQARHLVPKISDLPPGMNKAALHVTNSFLTVCAFVLSDCVWARSDWLLRLRNRPSEIRESYESNGMGALLDRFKILFHTIHIHVDENLDGRPAFPASLSSIHIASSGTPDSDELSDPAISEVYAKAVVSLKHVWAATLYDTSGSYAIVVWFVFVTDRFLELLWSGKPRALILAGHYCALMRRLANGGPWWMQRDWDKDIDKIVASVGERWRPWMDWVSADASDCHGGLVNGYGNEMALISASAFNLSYFHDFNWS